MPKYQTRCDGIEHEFDVPTGDYRLVCAMAVASADVKLPVYVRIWCNEVLPDYGPYTYRVQDEPQFGWLVVTAA